MTPVSTACSCPCCLGVVQGWCGRYGPGLHWLHWLQGTVYTSLQGPDPGGQSTLGVWWLNGSVNLQYFHRAPPVSAIISCAVYAMLSSTVGVRGRETPHFEKPLSLRCLYS